MKSFIQKHTSQEGRMETAKVVCGIAIFFSLMLLWGLTENATTLSEVIFAVVIGVSMLLFFVFVYNQLVEVDLIPETPTRMANIVIGDVPQKDDGLVIGFDQ